MKKRLLFLIVVSFIFMSGCNAKLDNESIDQSGIKTQLQPETENVIKDEIDITQ